MAPVADALLELAMWILAFISDTCDFLSLLCSDARIAIADREAAQDLIVESSARADVRAGQR